MADAGYYSLSESWRMRYGSLAIGGFVGAVAVAACVATPLLIRERGFSSFGLILAFTWIGTMCIGIHGLAAHRQRYWLVGLLLTAAVARLIMAVLIADHQFGADPAAYVTLARNIMAGQGLVMDDPIYGAHLRAMYPPLYPMLLAGIGSVLGLSSVSIVILNSLIDLGSAWLIRRMGTLIGRDDLGRIAALLFLMWPSFVLASPFPQKEGLSILLSLAVCFSFLRSHQSGLPLWSDAASLGLATGLLALTQPALAPLPLCFALVLLPRWGLRRILLLATRAMPFALLVMGAWWVRNWLIFGQFVPLTTSGGHSIMVAATGGHSPLPTAVSTLSEPARSAAMGRIGMSLISDEPARFAIDVGKRFVRSFAVEDFAVARMKSMLPPVPANGVALLTPVVQFAHMFALLAALASFRLRECRQDLSFVRLAIGACLLQILVFNLWFEFSERHRYFITPLLLLLAGSGIATLRSRRRSEDEQTSAPEGGV